MTTSMRYLILGFALATALHLVINPTLPLVWFVFVVGFGIGLLTAMLHFCIDALLSRT